MHDRSCVIFSLAVCSRCSIWRDVIVDSGGAVTVCRNPHVQLHSTLRGDDTSGCGGTDAAETSHLRRCKRQRASRKKIEAAHYKVLPSRLIPSRPLICLSLNEAIRGRVPYKRSVAVRPCTCNSANAAGEPFSRRGLKRFWPRLKRPGGFFALLIKRLELC